MCSNICSPIFIDFSYFSDFQLYVSEMPEHDKLTPSRIS